MRTGASGAASPRRSLWPSGRRPRPPLDEAERTYRRNARHLYLDIGWQGLIAATIVTFLSVFAVRLGASTLEVSLLTALPALATVIVSIPAASYIERHRDPHRITNVSRLVARSCFLLVALVPFALGGPLAYLAPAAIIAIWGVSAAASAFTVPAWTTVYCDAVPPARRASLNAGRWALYAVITALTVGFFGHALDTIPFPTNYLAVFGVAFVAGLLSTWHFSRLRVNSTHRPRSSRANALADALTLLRGSEGQRSFLRYQIGATVYRLGLNMPLALFALFWVNDLQASDTLIGLRTTAGYAVLVVGYLAFGRIATRYGHRPVLLVSSLALAAYPVATALVVSPEWLIPAAAIWGLGAAGIDIGFFEGLLRSCPPDRRAGSAAVDAALANLTIFVGPLLGAALAAVVGIREAFVVSGALCVVGTALFYRLGVGLSADSATDSTDASVGLSTDSAADSADAAVGSA